MVETRNGGTTIAGDKWDASGLTSRWGFGFRRFSPDVQVTRQSTVRWLTLFALFCSANLLVPLTAIAQVRVKDQDRGRYRPPVDVQPVELNDQTNRDPQTTGLVELVDHQVLHDPGDVIQWNDYPDSDWSPMIGGSCDGIGGCDSIACSGCNACTLCNPWFASSEVILWWRQPQQLAPLVTTNADPGTPRNQAGVLPEALTLFGNSREGDSVSVGGRFTLGRWLDSASCQSLTARYWLTGTHGFRFSADSAQHPILGRPYFEVPPGSGQQEALVIAYPGERTGNVRVRGNSEVHGADVSMRELWREGLGGRIDFMYGYQFMRVSEDLAIGSLSQSLGGSDPLPIGTIQSVQDSFRTTNEFHGGHFGFSGFYEEGCWTLDGLVKFAMGNVRRTAMLRGETLVDNVAIDDGLLVRQSNAGQVRSSTFAWIPEFNLNLGYRWRPNVDFNFGYSVIGLTRAWQPWRLIDPGLRSDLVSATAIEPVRRTRSGTFWVQGINFGLRWFY